MLQTTIQMGQPESKMAEIARADQIEYDESLRKSWTRSTRRLKDRGKDWRRVVKKPEDHSNIASCSDRIPSSCVDEEELAAASNLSNNSHMSIKDGQDLGSHIRSHAKSVMKSVIVSIIAEERRRAVLAE